jgi:hypothetical protein
MKRVLFATICLLLVFQFGCYELDHRNYLYTTLMTEERIASVDHASLFLSNNQTSWITPLKKQGNSLAYQSRNGWDNSDTLS